MQFNISAPKTTRWALLSFICGCYHVSGFYHKTGKYIPAPAAHNKCVIPIIKIYTLDISMYNSV